MYTQWRVLFSHKEEQNYTICRKINGTRGYHVKKNDTSINGDCWGCVPVRGKRVKRGSEKEVNMFEILYPNL
jgi:hypothetical protein